MEALDGNALAGQLFELFGREMTTALGACAHCGAVAEIATLVVYPKAPGTVVRCPRCAEVVIVVTEIRGVVRIALDHFALAQSGQSPGGGEA